MDAINLSDKKSHYAFDGGKMNRPKKRICFTHIRVDEWSPERNDRRKMRLIDTAKERSCQRWMSGVLGSEIRQLTYS